MKNKDKETLTKIIKYAKKAIDYVGNSSLDTFRDDAKTVDACAINIIQVGELVNRLSDEFIEATPNMPWHKMKGIRNRIVHDYEGMQFIIVYEVLTESLPQLILDIEKIIEHGDK